MFIDQFEAQRAANALRFDYDGNLTKSEIDLALAEKLDKADNSIDIFIVWDMDADSWSGRRTMKSMHVTLEGAEATIPDDLKKSPYDREPGNGYVKNYGYYAIEQRKVGL